MSDWSDYEMAPDPCPFCGKVNDRCSNIEGGDGPDPGDPTVCIGCGGISVFDEARRQRKPTDAELFELAMSDCWPTLQKARLAVMIALHRKPLPPAGRTPP